MFFVCLLLESVLGLVCLLVYSAAGICVSFVCMFDAEVCLVCLILFVFCRCGLFADLFVSMFVFLV